ncbi:ABC transporter permease subunit [Ramlibacter sp.]|uniref:ABC transporter permease subunit n=1 Tax=Ramlibacter sp. TaxID=1917967 RepID=UPI003D09F5AA
MTRMSTWLARPAVRPLLLLLVVVAGLLLADGAQGRVWSAATAYSVLQQFATLGPLALALGLTMMAREFDLSIGGTLSLAGCVAVLAGTTSPLLGLMLAVALGATAGLVQSGLMLRVGLGSISVTLGGLLVLSGLAYVVTNNETISYARSDVVAAVNDRVGGVFSWRSLLALAVFALAEFVVSWTRIGRDLLAVGSDRRASATAGVPVTAILCGTFAVAGMLAAGSGALLSFSLAAASPLALADTLAPAAAAAIVGGVSLQGGRGRPLGIAAGALVLCVLRSGLTAMGVAPCVHDIATGAVLLAVAFADSDDLRMRWHLLWRRAQPRRPITPSNT